MSGYVVVGFVLVCICIVVVSERVNRLTDRVDKIEQQPKGGHDADR